MDSYLWTISLGRDPFSMGSHLVGALLSLGATYVLVRRARRNGMRGIGAATYGVSMTLLFSVSTLFHYVEAGSPRLEFYNKLDHVAIFLMIAGTGTAIYAALQARWTPYLMGALWGGAMLGMLFKLTFWSMPDWLTASIYVIVGWLGSLGVVAIAWSADERTVRSFVFGGAVFSVGAVVYAAGWPVLWSGVIGAHEVFHLLVLLGAACHFDFVYRHCTAPPSPSSPQRVSSHGQRRRHSHQQQKESDEQPSLIDWGPDMLNQG